MSSDRLSRRMTLGGLAALASGAIAYAQMVRVAPSGGRLPEAPPPDVYVPPADLTTVLDIYKRMTGPVRVGNTGPYPFVADTGANQSVISAELAAKLGLAIGAPQALNGVAGVEMTPTCIASVGIGDRPARQTTLSVLSQDAIGGPGMLGLDLLGGSRLTLDFFRQAIFIDQGPSLPGDGQEIHAKAYKRDGQLTLVDANLAGIKVTAFLDSGAQNTIGNMALRQLALIRYPMIPFSTTPIISVTGQTADAQFADLPDLSFGGLTLPTWPVAFADLHIFRMWGLIERPAILIGVDVLSRFETVCLDFRRDEVRFRLPVRA